MLAVLKILQSGADCTLEIVSLLSVCHWRRVHFSAVWSWELEITLFTAFPKAENVLHSTKASSRCLIFCLRVLKFLKNWKAHQLPRLWKILLMSLDTKLPLIYRFFSRSSALWATEEQDWEGQLESQSLLVFPVYFQHLSFVQQHLRYF